MKIKKVNISLFNSHQQENPDSYGSFWAILYDKEVYIMKDNDLYYIKNT